MAQNGQEKVQVDRKKFPTDAGDCYVSNLQVMSTPAGYYIGRTCWDKEFGYEEPYSRESGYMTKEEAEKALKESGFEVRQCLENQMGYEAGTLPKDAPNDPKNTIPVDIQCRGGCKKTITLQVPTKEWEAYQSGDGLIQQTLASLTDEQREMFMSGICPACWKKTFGEKPGSISRNLKHAKKPKKK